MGGSRLTHGVVIVPRGHSQARRCRACDHQHCCGHRRLLAECPAQWQRSGWKIRQHRTQSVVSRFCNWSRLSSTQNASAEMSLLHCVLNLLSACAPPISKLAVAHASQFRPIPVACRTSSLQTRVQTLYTDSLHCCSYRLPRSRRDAVHVAVASFGIEVQQSCSRSCAAVCMSLSDCLEMCIDSKWAV